MELLNIAEELENLRLNFRPRQSMLQFAGLCGMSYFGYKNTIQGKTRNIRESTIEEIERGTGYIATIDGASISFRKPMDSELEDVE